jgi:fibronectin-binding autotransporter adhesin
MKSRILLVSLICYSQGVWGDYVVNSAADDGSPGTLRDAIVQVNSVPGGTISFDSSMAGQTIFLLSPLPPIDVGIATITLGSPSDPTVIVHGNNQYFGFFIASGSASMSNLCVQNCAAIGGTGGGPPGFCGGGGGLGAGGGLFVNKGVTLLLSDVSFITNTAQGGAGGASAGTATYNSGSGGGGGCNYGLLSAGGAGATSPGFSAPGGGGGGSTPGMDGNEASGLGGHGGGPGGGAGGYSDGGSGTAPFSGGGGAGNGPQGMGGAGADFGGGGGGGAPGFLGDAGVGGPGGFGGGGGGGEISAGAGGFGGGGGGGQHSAAGFGGGVGLASGGGGAGLGGAIFIREGGSLTLSYSNANPPQFNTNTAVGGVGGDSGASGGEGLGQDIFLSSGGNLTFIINNPLQISTGIKSDTLSVSNPVVIQGSSVLTFTGNNTYGGGTLIEEGGRLDVASDTNLGLPGAAVTLDNGTLGVTAVAFSTNRPFFLGDGGGSLLISPGLTANFSGAIAPTGIGVGGVSIIGGGTAVLSGNNSYGGTTTMGSNTNLTIAANQALPPLTSILGPGSLSLISGIEVRLEGNNTYSGTTTIPVGATLVIGASSALSPQTSFVNNGALIMQYDVGIASLTAMQGSGQLVMQGAGTLVLPNHNTYSGGSFFNNGIVQISATAALGSSGLFFNGGSLELLNPFSGIFTAPITLGGAGGVFIPDAGVEATIATAMTGAGPFSCLGTGTLVLKGANTYQSFTTIGAEATLVIGTSAALPANSTVDDRGLLVFDFPSGTVANTISDIGSVSVTAGNIVFTGNNTYGGTTTIAPGATLTIGSTGGLSPNSATIVDNGSLIFNLPTPSSAAVVGGAISGAGGLEIQTGNVTFTGVNTYTTITHIDANGTLNIGSSGSIPVGGVISDLGQLIFTNTSGTALPGAISGAGSVGMSGPGGSVLLSSADTYSGGTQLTSGTVQISAASGLGSGPLTFNGGTLELLNPFVGPISATATLQAGGGRIQIDAGISAVYSGSLQGPGSLTCAGQGQLTLLGNNTYGGTTAIDPSVTLVIGATSALSSGGGYVDQGILKFDFAGGGTVANAIGGPGTVHIVTGDVIFDGGAKTYGGTTTINPGATLTIALPSAFPRNSPVIDNGFLVFDLPTQTSTLGLSGAISGAGGIEVIEGTLTLSGYNSYGALTIIDTGATLKIGSTGGIPVGGAVTDNGTLVFQNKSGTALPGPISGAGIVAMSGTGGRLLLSNADTYSGGTQFKNGIVEIHTVSALGSGELFFNGGTLELLPSFIGPISATASLGAKGGTVQVDAGVVATYSGVIQGVGPLNDSGSGTLILSAQNSYGGTTTIGPLATLQINATAALGPAAVVDQGSLVFNVPADTIANAISGAGTVTLTGAGNFNLTHVPNTYSGGTIISQGTLQVSNLTQIGSGPLTIEQGATFEPTVSLTTDLPIILSNGGGSIQVGNAIVFTDSGPITDTGSNPLSITGPGQMIYSGTDSSPGNTTVQVGSYLGLNGASMAGPVFVKGELVGQGSVGPLTNSGTIILTPAEPPGTPTLNVAGSYTQNPPATLQVTLRGSGDATLLNVSQTAQLHGTLAIEAPSQEGYAFDQTYKVITAFNPITTQFAHVNFPPVPQLVIVYNVDPSVDLIVTEQSVFAGVSALRHNPEQVLINLQEIVHTPSSDLLHVISAMSAFDSEQLTEALDQLHPAQFGAFDLLNVNTSERIASLFTEHTERGCKGKGVWVAPFGYFYDQEKIGEQLGFRADAVGLIAGLNFCAREGYLLGLGAAYSSSEVHWHESRGHGSMDKVSLGMYTNYAAHGWSIDGALVGGLDVFNATRNIAFSTINRAAKHERGGYDLTAHIGVSGDVKLGRFYLSPFGKADYFNLYQKGFTESGADALNLTVEGRHAQMLRSELGLKFTSSWKMGRAGCFAPTVHLSGINECSLVKRHYKANFMNETPRYLVRTFSNPIYLISPGLDLNFNWGYGLNFSLGYSAELNSQITTQKLTGRLGWFF